MIQADYDFYRQTYCGNTVPSDVFDQVAGRAEILLESFIRLREGQSLDETKVKLTLCAVCDWLYQNKDQGHILREGLDGYDATYDRKAGGRELLCIIRQHLGAEGVLYRGRRV